MPATEMKRSGIEVAHGGNQAGIGRQPATEMKRSGIEVVHGGS